MRTMRYVLALIAAVMLFPCASAAQGLTLFNLRVLPPEGSRVEAKAFVVSQEGIIIDGLSPEDLAITINGSAAFGIQTTCTTPSVSAATVAAAMLFDCTPELSSDRRELQVLAGLSFLRALYAPRLDVQNTIIGHGGAGLPLLKPLSADPDSAVMALHNLPPTGGSNTLTAAMLVAISQLQQSLLSQRLMLVFTTPKTIGEDNILLQTLRNNRITPVFLTIGGKTTESIRSLCDSLGGYYLDDLDDPEEAIAAVGAVVEMIQRERMPCRLEWRDPMTSCRTLLRMNVAIPALGLEKSIERRRPGTDARLGLQESLIRFGPQDIGASSFAATSVNFDINNPARTVYVQAEVLNSTRFALLDAEGLPTSLITREIASGEEALLNLRFLPDSYGIDTARIVVRGALEPDNIGLLCTDTIYAVGLGFPPVQLRLPDTSLATNECAEVPLVASIDRPWQLLRALGMDTIRAIVRVGSFMVEPQDELAEGQLVLYDRFVRVRRPTIELTDSALAELGYCAMLGRSDTAHLRLSHAEVSAFPGFRFGTQSGVIRLGDVCRDGGTRLYFDFGEFRFRRISPNPSSSSFTVEYELGEHGFTEMTLHDISGNVVRTIFSGLMLAGTYQLEVPRQFLPAGAYFLSLRSPTQSAMYKVMLTN